METAADHVAESIELAFEALDWAQAAVWSWKELQRKLGSLRADLEAIRDEVAGEAQLSELAELAVAALEVGREFAVKRDGPELHRQLAETRRRMRNLEEEVIADFEAQDERNDPMPRTPSLTRAAAAIAGKLPETNGRNS